MKKYMIPVLCGAILLSMSGCSMRAKKEPETTAPTTAAPTTTPLETILPPLETVLPPLETNIPDPTVDSNSTMPTDDTRDETHGTTHETTEETTHGRRRGDRRK